MIPPVSGRELDPEPNVADESAMTSPTAARPYSDRAKILLFGVFMGVAVGLIYAFFSALLVLASASFELFGDTRRFVPTFATLFTTTAPWFVLVATLAAAAERLIRRSQRDARATRALLRALTGAPDAPPTNGAPERRASDIVEPLRRERDMELGPTRDDG